MMKKPFTFHFSPFTAPKAPAWFLAARPKTLPAAVVPVWVGSAPALVGKVEGGSWFLFVCALGGCLCIQVATNLFNDAIDHGKGADTGKRIGPVRVSASGLLPTRVVMAGAAWFCTAAAIFGFFLTLERGWPIVAIGLVSLYFSYGYTGGPWPLAYRGLGEIFVILFFGLVAVLGSYFVQTGEWAPGWVWLVALQCGLYSSVLIAVNNLRDVEEDRESGKRTLAVRFGEGFARWEIAVFCLAPIGLWLLIGLEGKRLAIYLLVSAFFVYRILSGVLREVPSKKFNKYLAMAAGQLMVFAAFYTKWLFWGDE